MLDIKIIRENPELVKKACQVKGYDDNVIDKIVALDFKIRNEKTEVQSIVAEKNKISKEIQSACDKAPLIAKAKELGEQANAIQTSLDTHEAEFNELMLWVPQIPDTSTPIGKDDSDNIVIKNVGEPRKFDFQPLPHWEILDKNKWWLGDKISDICGPRTYSLMGEAAELELALQNFVIQKLISKGLRYINVPSLTKKEIIFKAGHFAGSNPDIMDQDVFQLAGTEKCLSGTAEIIINSLYSNEILSENDLPLVYCGYSPCFRKEAGKAGKDTRGLMRVHQFHKVEEYVFCKNDKAESDKMFDFILNNSVEIMEDLEIPYRLLKVCTGDAGFNKQKQTDLEAWIPSENCYREMGSCSAIGDFQARRTNTRYRENATGEVKYCMTLNNTGIALPRSIIAILENHQTANGKIRIPEKLQPFMNGKKIIG